MITEEEAESALNYLLKTDKEAARAKAHFMALDDMKKPALAMIYNELREGSAADKLKRAEGSVDYTNHLENLKQANEEWLILQNHRKTAELKIEMWRSMNANQRKGNI